jgi:hypothetical protein
MNQMIDVMSCHHRRATTAAATAGWRQISPVTFRRDYPVSQRFTTMKRPERLKPRRPAHWSRPCPIRRPVAVLGIELCQRLRDRARHVTGRPGVHRRPCPSRGCTGKLGGGNTTCRAICHFTPDRRPETLDGQLLIEGVGVVPISVPVTFDSVAGPADAVPRRPFEHYSIGWGTEDVLSSPPLRPG